MNRRRAIRALALLAGAELAIEQPTRFALTVDVLVRADRVIE